MVNNTSRKQLDIQSASLRGGYLAHKGQPTSSTSRQLIKWNLQ